MKRSIFAALGASLLLAGSGAAQQSSSSAAAEPAPESSDVAVASSLVPSIIAPTPTPIPDYPPPDEDEDEEWVEPEAPPEPAFDPEELGLPEGEGEGEGEEGAVGAERRFWGPPTVYKYWKGKSYSCKCYPGDWCWPSQFAWNALNWTVGGNLRINVPIGASCYNKFTGPLGTRNTYDAAKCAEVTANFVDEQYQYVTSSLPLVI